MLEEKPEAFSKKIMNTYTVVYSITFHRAEYVVVAENETDAKILVQEIETIPAQRSYPVIVPDLDDLKCELIPGVYGRSKGVKARI